MAVATAAGTSIELLDAVSRVPDGESSSSSTWLLRRASCDLECTDADGDIADDRNDILTDDELQLQKLIAQARGKKRPNARYLLPCSHASFRSFRCAESRPSRITSQR